MLTVDEAFRKFKSRLELNDKEQKNASDRHTEVREYIRTKFAIDRDFLTGSLRALHQDQAAEGHRHLLRHEASGEALPRQVGRRRSRRLQERLGREVRREGRAAAEPVDQRRLRRATSRKRTRPTTRS